MAEVILAMVILSVGLLALASGSAGVIRQMRSGNVSATASMVAQSRLETMRSRPCSNLSAGSATTRGLSEKWGVNTSVSPRFTVVAETVTYIPRRGVTKTYVVNGLFPCN